MTELENKRIELFRKAARFETVERTPYFSSAVTWKIFDAGLPLSLAETNFDAMRACVARFLRSYPVDGLLDTGIRNQFWVTEAFQGLPSSSAGNKSYYYYTDEAVAVHDHAFCTAENLKEYLENPSDFVWNKLLPEKYGEIWQTRTKKDWQKTYKAYFDYVKFIISGAGMVKKEFGIPSTAPNNPIMNSIDFGIEVLLSNVLGIKQLSIAMRRNADLIEEFCKTWDAQHIDPLIEKVKKGKGPNLSYCFDASIMLLAQNILSPKQFERFYAPSLKKLLDAYAEKGCNVRIFCEGSIKHIADVFAGYPKGLLTLHLEQDSPEEIGALLPNACIMGGLTTELLSGASPQSCVDRAKELQDKLGGGLILSENKMLSFRSDCCPENLAAVLSYVTGREVVPGPKLNPADFPKKEQKGGLPLWLGPKNGSLMKILVKILAEG